MSDSKFDVLSVGNAIVDIITECDEATLEKLGLPKGHMQLVCDKEADKIYQAIGPAIEKSGGSAANTAAGIASFGGKSAFIGMVADDQFGKIFAHDLQAIGVDFTTPPLSGANPTARCLVCVTPDGERTMSTYLGACTALGEDNIDEDLVRASQIIYLEGYLFDPEEAKAAFYKAAQLAKAGGRQVALSLSDSFCIERHRDDFKRFITDHVDILFANEDEITTLYQTDQFAEAGQMCRGDVKLGALTQGAKGSMIIAGDKTMAVPPFPATELVDTTGAGDLYAAGFLFGLTRGQNLESCGALASLAAAEIISHIGARPELNLRDHAHTNDLL